MDRKEQQNLQAIKFDSAFLMAKCSGVEESIDVAVLSFHFEVGREKGAVVFELAGYFAGIHFIVLIVIPLLPFSCQMFL